MTLEEILKSLKKGDVKVYEYEKAPEGYSNTIIVVLTENGEYQFRLKTKYDYFIPHSHNIEDLLEQIKEDDVFDWTEIDYEVFIPREELKSEVKQLEKALINACRFLSGEITCTSCHFKQECNVHLSSNNCVENIYNYFLEKAKSNEFR